MNKKLKTLCLWKRICNCHQQVSTFFRAVVCQNGVRLHHLLKQFENLIIKNETVIFYRCININHPKAFLLSKCCNIIRVVSNLTDINTLENMLKKSNDKYYKEATCYMWYEYWLRWLSEIVATQHSNKGSLYSRLALFSIIDIRIEEIDVGVIIGICHFLLRCLQRPFTRLNCVWPRKRSMNVWMAVSCRFQSLRTCAQLECYRVIIVKFQFSHI